MHALNENIMRNIRVKSLQEQEKQILFGSLMLCMYQLTETNSIFVDTMLFLVIQYVAKRLGMQYLKNHHFIQKTPFQYHEYLQVTKQELCDWEEFLIYLIKNMVQKIAMQYLQSKPCKANMTRRLKQRARQASSNIAKRNLEQLGWIKCMEDT